MKRCSRCRQPLRATDKTDHHQPYCPQTEEDHSDSSFSLPSITSSFDSSLDSPSDSGSFDAGGGESGGGGASGDW